MIQTSLIIPVRMIQIFNLSKNDMSVAAWTFQHSAKAGKHTDTLPSGNYTFYPLKGKSDES